MDEWLQVCFFRDSRHRAAPAWQAAFKRLTAMNYLAAAQHFPRTPPENPPPDSKPEIDPSQRPGPELPQLPPDPAIPPGPQGPEIIPDTSPPEIPPMPEDV
jgi:hypothetical protein